LYFNYFYFCFCFYFIKEYDYDLKNTKYWEHFLPENPQSVQRETLGLKHNENENFKNLEMPNAWVTVIEVPIKSRCFILKKPQLFSYVTMYVYVEYLMLYPNGKKIVPYMNANKEYYADYIMPDGLVKRTTFYTEPEYLKKTFVQEIYKNRIDKLICIDTKYAVEGTETIEYFIPGRNDYLKSKILRKIEKKIIYPTFFRIFLQNISFMGIVMI